MQCFIFSIASHVLCDDRELLHFVTKCYYCLSSVLYSSFRLGISTDEVVFIPHLPN